MESITQFFFNQWQKKLVAVIIAIVIWILVSYSITATRTIPSVPIRVINLPVDKTIQGLLPNGFLIRRVALTLTGTKDIVEQLEPGDIEVLLDVSNLPNEGVVQINKKNLVSLNPNVNLLRHITSVDHPEFVIKMSLMMTEKIPITIRPPIGSPPEGYEFLDIWPTKLMQTVSGPQDIILNLKNQGLELTFNLNEINKEDLADLKSDSISTDEISFSVPEHWKKIIIPLTVNVSESLNDPEAKNLQINFLRKELIPIKNEIPIGVFYPLKYSEKINPKTNALAANEFLIYQNHIPVLKVPLFAYNVSRLFLDIVSDHLQIDIVAAPKSERTTLEWNVDFINIPHLEDTFVAFLMSSLKHNQDTKSLEKEKFFRQRFRNYIQKFSLYISDKQPLELDSHLEDSQIVVRVLHIDSSKPKVDTTPAHAR